MGSINFSIWKVRMEKLSRFLRNSPKVSVFDRRLSSNSGKSIHSSASGYGNGFGKKCRDDVTRKSNVRTCFGLYGYQGKNFRDCMERGVLEDTRRRIQHRGFGSLPEKVQRNASFSTLNSDDISYFKGILGEKNVVEDEERLAIANTDWMHKYRGSSKLLLQPRSTEEVSQILKYCNSRNLAVVPQGGNTGLVGGSVPVFDEVVVNMSLMNNVISFDKVDMQRHLFISGAPTIPEVNFSNGSTPKLHAYEVIP